VPATEGFEFASIAIDRHADVNVAFVALLGGLGQRMLKRAEDDILVDVFSRASASTNNKISRLMLCDS
jgi:hypothetical protein